jgi:hypothetical protein
MEIFYLNILAHLFKYGADSDSTEAIVIHLVTDGNENEFLPKGSAG